MWKNTKKQTEAIKSLSDDSPEVAFMGGSRSGKTCIFLKAMIIRALKAENSNHAIIRRTLKDCKTKIGLVSLPEVIRGFFPTLKYEVNKIDWIYTFPNGSRIWLSGLDDKDRADRILGLKFSTIFFNECSEISYESAVIAKTRLEEKNDLVKKVYWDFNPPTVSHWTYDYFIKLLDPVTKTPHRIPISQIKMNPIDNLDNLDKNYLRILETLPARQRKRFLDGEFQLDFEDAYVKRSMICRIESLNDIEFEQIVVGVDPAVSNNKSSNETGIVIAGRTIEKRYIILNDYSGRYSPNEWAKVSVDAYKEFEANYIVAESNQGGDLVRSNIINYNNEVPVELVRATKGKLLRFEPIAALYERELVSHFQFYPELEDQLCEYDGTGESPDRLDALVWALSALMDNSDYIDPHIGDSDNFINKKEGKNMSEMELIENEALWESI